jgi:mannitol/fructose-specific phosphotransferase system IIA component (Ntr-type)
MLTLRNYLFEEKIAFFEETEKERALRRMVELTAADSRVEDPDGLFRAVMDREEIYSTGIGFGIALPHARTSAVKRITMALGVFPEGIDYGSMDDKPVKIIVCIAVPEFDQDLYIRVLSRVLAFLKKEREKLLRCQTPEEILELANKY